MLRAGVYLRYLVSEMEPVHPPPVTPFPASAFLNGRTQKTDNSPTHVKVGVSYLTYFGCRVCRQISSCVELFKTCDALKPVPFMVSDLALNNLIENGIGR